MYDFKITDAPNAYYFKKENGRYYMSHSWYAVSFDWAEITARQYFSWKKELKEVA